MPELPEVETVCRTLTPVIGQRVQALWTSGLPLRLNQPVDKRALRTAAVGSQIVGIRRLGKYILVDFSTSGDRPGRAALVHLGMSGRFRLMAANQPRPKHTHVVFVLGDGRELRYSDPRRFGQVSVVIQGAERAHPSLGSLGLDPLTDPLTGLELHALTQTSRRTMKSFLLDQTVVAGIGNIYASEALWEARIRPGLRANKLSRPRANGLAIAIKSVLWRALENGGTSLRDFVNAHGVQGDHSHYLWVYDRAECPCPRETCSGRIRRTVDQGRATFWCPRCQIR